MAKFKRLPLLLVLILLVPAILWLRRDRGARPDHLVECGHDGPADTSSLIDDIKAVPEFHDCQRFIVYQGDEPVYDSLFAIYASSTLRGPIRSLAGPGVPAVVPGANLVAANLTPPPVRLVPVALIVAGNAYAPLGIEAGLNCLFLGVEDQASDKWVAYILKKVPTGEAGCTKVEFPRDDTSQAKRLEVKRTVAPGFENPEDYPPVARWDWDPKARQQYIGIYCDGAWCEIGEQDFTPSDPLPMPSGLTTGERRVRAIKGWYDQQFLAKRGPNGKLVPSGVRGTIVAHPDLGAKEDADFMAGYVEVASVYLETPGGPDEEALKEYEDKFAFVPNAPNTTDGSRRLLIKGAAGDKWEGRIPKTSGWMSYTFLGHKDKSITRRPVRDEFKSKGYTVPGVARWRWMKNDEGTWTRCSAGCCEMSE